MNAGAVLSCPSDTLIQDVGDTLRIFSLIIRCIFDVSLALPYANLSDADKHHRVPIP